MSLPFFSATSLEGEFLLWSNAERWDRSTGTKLCHYFIINYHLGDGNFVADMSNSVLKK
jgi:hypothetical protein